jgi:hypothetical protein
MATNAMLDFKSKGQNDRANFILFDRRVGDPLVDNVLGSILELTS